MALFSELNGPDREYSAESALRVPLGAASPLWFAFASAASAGVAFWWMTRWTRPANLEAFGDWFKAKSGDSLAPGANLPAITAQPDISTPVSAALEPVTAAQDALVATVVEAAAPVAHLAEDTQALAIETVAKAADDLTRIVGIGPRLAQRLNELGVQTFAELSAWTDEDLLKFDRALDLKGRAVRDAWVAQARRFTEA